jgi:hypothetical protein
LVLAALSAYIYWFEREPVSDGEGEEVFGVEEDSIVRIEIEKSSESASVVVEKDEEKGWRLVSPVAAEADEVEVGVLLQNLATMRFERALAQTPSAKLFEFGLESPKIQVRFRTKDGVERGLAFGSDTPTPGNQYARRDGSEDVLVLPSHLSLNFDKSGWDLRDKRVFALKDSPEAKRIAIERPEGDVTLLKEGGLWFVAEPRSRADRNRATGIASRIRTAEMKEIASETRGNLESYGLAAPSRRVRVEFEGERSPLLELEIGANKDSNYYAGTPAREQVFVLASDLVKELDASLSDLQSKRLFDYSTFAVKRVRIEAKAAPPRELERLDSEEEMKWREKVPEPGRDLDTTAVEDLLYALNGATGSLGPAPSKEEPDFTITVGSGDPPIEETVRVRKRADGVEIERAGEAVSLVLTPEAWSDIEVKMKLEPPGAKKEDAK